MNILTRTLLAARVAINQAHKSARVAFRRPALAMEVLNRYEAGRRWQFGDRSYLWDAYVTDARFDADQATRTEIVRRIRYFEANCPLVQRLADIWEQYVVGANGLVISADSKDEDWNIASDGYFDEWSQFPDIASLQTWPTIQGLIARTWFIDGEVFILKTRGKTAPYRPRIQLIEGHRVGTPPGMADWNGNKLIDGAEVDESGRTIAWWIRADLDATKYARIDAQWMIHVAEPSRVGMIRPLSHFYAVLNTLHDLDDLQRLEMQAAKDAAETTKIIKTPSGEPLDDATDWDAVNQTGDATTGQNTLTEYYRRIFGATTKVMKIGDEYEQNVSNRPSVAQQWYWRYLAEMVCVGVGIPLVLVYPDSMQGTVLRGTLDSANHFFRSRSCVLSAAFKQVRNYVIGSGSNQDSRIANKPPDWTTQTVRPPKAVNVDVGRNSAAMLAEVKSGTRTFQDVYAEMGDDWKAKLRQRAKEAAFLHQLAKEFKVTPQEISDVAEAAFSNPALQQPQPKETA